MDLNQLYYEYQVLRVRAERARSPKLERECTARALAIAGMIGDRQRGVGAGAGPGWSRIARGGPDGSGASPRQALALPLAANWNPA
ncbi:MAG: hypothetical protein ACO1OD_13010 [Croceibacterium sp.]